MAAATAPSPAQTRRAEPELLRFVDARSVPAVLQARTRARAQGLRNRSVRYARADNVLRKLLQGSVTLPLAPGRVARFVVTHGNASDPVPGTMSSSPTYYFSGKVYDARRGRADTVNTGTHGFFAVTNGRLMGTVQDDESAYQIESLDATTLSIIQTDWSEMGNIDSGALRPDNNAQGSREGANKQMMFSAQQAEAEASGLPTQVDVVVVYTTKALQRAAAAGQDYVAQSAYSVAYTNQIYQNSGISARLRLVAIGTTDFIEYELKPDVSLITKGSSSFSHQNVSNIRDQYNADIAIMVGDYYRNNATPLPGQTLGAAFKAVDQGEVPGGPIEYDQDFAFGIVDYDFMGRADHTFPHEAGHVYGADHDPDNDTSPNSGFWYGHGKYRDGWCQEWLYGSKWQTVMAYGQRRMIPYFSSPSLTYGGNSIGSSTQNNVLVHNTTAYAVSLFRNPPAPPLVVDLQGPSSAPQGATVTYTAAVSTGQIGVQYTWRRRTADVDEDQPGTVVQTGGTTYTMVLNEPGFVEVEVTNAQGASARDGVYTGFPYVDPCVKPTLPGCGIDDPAAFATTRVTTLGERGRVVYTEGRLDVRTGESGPSSVDVYDLLGRRVASHSYMATGAPEAFALPRLQPGIYVITVSVSGARTFTQTMVVR